MLLTGERRVITTHVRTMNLTLPDEEAAALTADINGNDRYTFSEHIGTLKAIHPQAQVGAGPRALPPAEALRTADDHRMARIAAEPPRSTRKWALCGAKGEQNRWIARTVA